MRLTFLKVIGLFFLLTQVVAAQELQLSGTVVEQDRLPLPYANVVLLRASDSVVVEGATTLDDGSFLFETISAGSYLLQVSYVGFVTAEQGVTLESSVQLPPLVMSPETQSLQGVTVSTIKPTVEKKPDRLIFRVANTSLSAFSGYEILRRTPGVLMINDQLLVKNSVPVIYLNDKRVYLSDSELRSLLQGYSGSNVEAIEVITNPPARYDAEGSVVLNIVTRSNISIGYKGSLEGRGQYAVFPKYNLATQHYYKNDKLDFFFNYNFNRQKLYKRDKSFTNFFDGSLPSDVYENDFQKITRQNDHSVNSILDIKTGASSSLTLSANLLWSPDKSLGTWAETEITDANGILNSSFNTNGDLENDTYNYVFGGEWQKDLDEEGSRWVTTANYIYFQQGQEQFLGTTFNDASGQPLTRGSFFTDASQQNNIFTLQSDLSLSRGRDDISAGVKYSNISSKSRIDYSGGSIPADATNDDFDYDESIYAAYMDLHRDWGRWTLQLGLRSEYTDVKANSLTLGEVNTQEYFNLFPSAGLQFTPSDDHSYSLSYGRKIARPRYQSLNPFRYYVLGNQYQEGNPALTRALEDKITLGYTFKNTYSFELYYENTDNHLQLMMFQDNPNRRMYEVKYNIDYLKQYSLDFSAPVSVSNRWYFFVYTSLFYMENRFEARESGGVMVTNHTNSFFGMLYNSFTLDEKATLSLDLQYDYSSHYIYGSYDFRDQQSLAVTLRKSLWEDRGVLTLGLTDAFNTQNVPMRSQYLNQDNGFLWGPETRRFTVSFRYNFGNFKLQDNERDTKPAELERLKAPGEE